MTGAGAGGKESANMGAGPSSVAGTAGADPAMSGAVCETAQRTYDVFISYAHDDGRDVAVLLEEVLVKRGLHVWRDEARLSVGDAMSDEIKNGLARSSYVLAVISPAYLESNWTMMELGSALLGRRSGRILPVLHGIDPKTVSKSVPALADRFMYSWDGDPKRLVDRVVQAIENAGSGGRALAAGIAASAGAAGSGPRGRSRQGHSSAIAAGEDAERRRVHDMMREYSRGTLLSIPSGIGDLVIPRTEADRIRSRLGRDDRIVLTGDKGSGKSVILCQLYEKLAAEGRRAVFARCDDFLQPDSDGGLDGMLGGGTSLLGFLGGVRDGSETVFLFDSLDAASRNDRSMSAFRKFLRRLWAFDGVKTVCSVRAYDYEHSPAMSRDQWGREVRVGDLDERVLEDALGRMGIPAVPDGLKRMLRNPLRLKLLHMIAARNPGADFSKITNEARLYGEHWKEYVDKGGPRGGVARTLLDVAAEMIKTRSVAIPADAVKAPAAGLDAARSCGILVDSGNQLRFFHHAYLDYVASLRVLRDYRAILDFLELDEYNVFFRPAVAFALSILRDRGNAGYLRAVTSICRSGLKHYWKISALGSLAGEGGFSAEEAEPIRRLLTADPVLQRHFLEGAARERNPFWFRMWSGTALEEWAGRGRNAELVAGYIWSLSGHKEHHAEMLKLARLLVSNGRLRPAACEWIVMMTARMSAPGKAAWYEELSLDGNARVRAGVLHCLEALLDEDPDAAAAVFRNVAVRGAARRRIRPAPRGPLGISRQPTGKEREEWSPILKAKDMYGRLLLKSPAAMARAAIESVWILRGGDGPPGARRRIAEDPADLWSGGWGPTIHATMLSCVGDALPRLLDADAPAYAALISSSRLAVFHRILLGALLEDPPRFRDLIYDRITDPDVLSLPSMRGHVREAIRIVSPLLSGRQSEALLARIADLGPARGRPAGSSSGGGPAALKSLYLSAFDRSRLSRGHLEFLDRFPPPAPPPSRGLRPPRPAVPLEMPLPMPPRRAAPLPGAGRNDLLGDALERLSLAGPDCRAAPDLLKEVVDMLGDDGIPLDASAAGRSLQMLLDLAGRADPRRGGPAGPPSTPDDTDNTRELVARGLIRLCARAADARAADAIEQLSKDGSPLVRAGVAEELELLFDADPALAGRITARYSSDRDPRVLCNMKGPLLLLAQTDEDAALASMENMLSLSDIAPDEAPDVARPLLFLALSRRNRPARAMLDAALADASLPRNVRLAVAHLLGPYLSREDARDGALEVFLLLLDSGDYRTREDAAHCLTSAAAYRAGDPAVLLEKSQAHLDRMAREEQRGGRGHRILETLTAFLKDHWHRMPERALGHLERVAALPEAPYQPVIMENAVETLNGLFRTLPDEDGRRRCLSVLDEFIKAGWPDALGLLRKMERPD